MECPSPVPVSGQSHLKGFYPGVHYQCPVYSVQYTVDPVGNTAHSTQHTPPVPSVQCAAYSAPSGGQSTQHTAHSTSTVQYTQDTVYSAHTGHSVQCNISTRQHTVQCTHHSIEYIVHYCIWEVHMGALNNGMRSLHGVQGSKKSLCRV